MNIVNKIFGRFLKMTAKLYSDELYLKLLFRNYVGYPLNLRNPKTYNEKLQWLKLNDHNPAYTRMVDKYEAKKYVAEIIGEEHIIPTLALYDSVDDIDFDTLPDKFVLKCTHDSGGIVICKDKSKLDKTAAIKKLRKGLKKNFYWENREWPYKDVKPRIIAEMYMADENDELNDYKVFNFNGIPKIVEVDYNRFKGHLRNLYNTNWEKIDALIRFPTSERTFPKPQAMEEILGLANKLSCGIPHVRTDFYIVDNKIFFGELTFYHGSGFETILPKEFDEKMGGWIKLQKGTIDSDSLGGVVFKDDMYVVINVVLPKDDLPDYKFFCFDGQPKFMFIATDRFTKGEETKFDFFDMKFNHLPFLNGHPNSIKKIEIPDGFEEMKLLASKLSKGIPQVRIDFYNVNGTIYFGEITLFHWSGIVPFEPVEWDYKFGEMLRLPQA